MIDVAIIGAGVAGLTAARELSGHGLSLEILEARPRTGGRIQTIHDPDLAVPIEAGAEFVHGTPEGTWQIIRSAKLAAADIPDSHWHFLDGRLRNAGDFWEEVDQVMGKLSTLKRDMTFAQFMEQRCRRTPERVKALTIGYVEGFNAADATKISSIGLRKAEEAAEEINSDRNFRLLRGYETIIRWLSAGLDPARCALRLNTVVSRIAWKTSCGTITASCCGHDLSISAKRVVITVPIGVLKARAGQPAAIEFSPDVPQIHRAVQHIEFGPVLKMSMIFREPFWERDSLPILGKGQSLRDMAFLHSQKEDAAFPTWWSMLPVRTNMLVGWAGGPAASRLTGKPPATILSLALSDLSRVTGLKQDEIASLVQSHQVFDWPADPFARGAYSYPALGGVEAIQQLARPIRNTLFVAGEATNPGMSGTVEGAISSGYRVARQVLSSI